MATKVFISSGVTSSGMVVPDSTDCFVLSGGLIQSTQVKANGGVTLIAGSASSTRVSSGGHIALQNGGYATDTTILAGGILRVSAGATANGVTLNGGASGTIAGNLSNVSVLSGGQIAISSGANISAIEIANGGVMILSLAKGVNVSGHSAGVLLSVSDGKMSDINIQSGNELSVYSGASASSIGIASGANLFVYTGAYINGLSIDEGVAQCTFDLDKNTTVINASYNGNEFNISGGTATNLIIPKDGALFLSSGITANMLTFYGEDMQVSAGAKVYSSFIYGSIDDMQGLMSATTLCRSAYVELTGGTAVDTSILPEGRLYATNGTLAGNIYVGGTLYLKSGTKITSDTSLFFDISNRGPGTKKKDILVSSFQYANFASYRLVTTRDQQDGTYLLATNAGAFSAPVTLFSDDVVLGDLTVGGSKIASRSGSYTLFLDGSNQLNLTVNVAPITVYVNSAWDGLADGTVVSIDTSTEAIIGTDAFSNCEAAQNRVAYGGSIINKGTGKSVFENGMTDATISGDCYVHGDDVVFSDIITAGTVFCGDVVSSPTPNDKTVSLDNVNVKRLFANGLASDLSQTQENTNTIGINDSVFTNALFGGCQIVNTSSNLSRIETDTSISVTNTSTSLFFGNSNMLGTSVLSYTATIEGDTSVTLDHVTATNYVGGGSLIGSYSHEVRVGNTTLNIIGGTYSTAVFGGSLVQSTTNAGCNITGDITINISGDAQIKQLYGSSMALKVGPTKETSLTGNISISIDVSDGVSISDALVLGGAAKSNIYGNGSLVFTGHASSPLFATTTIMGDSSYGSWGTSYFSGQRSLVFNNFSGNIAGRVVLFTEIIIDEYSQVEFSKYNNNFDNVTSWDISGVKDSTSVLFSSDLFDYDFTNVAFELTCELDNDDTWTIMKANSIDNFENFSEARFTLNDDVLTLDDEFTFTGEIYKIELQDDGALVASKLA